MACFSALLVDYGHNVLGKGDRLLPLLLIMKLPCHQPQRHLLRGAPMPVVPFADPNSLTATPPSSAPTVPKANPSILTFVVQGHLRFAVLV